MAPEKADKDGLNLKQEDGVKRRRDVTPRGSRPIHLSRSGQNIQLKPRILSDVIKTMSWCPVLVSRDWNALVSARLWSLKLKGNAEKPFTFLILPESNQYL